MPKPPHFMNAHALKVVQRLRPSVAAATADRFETIAAATRSSAATPIALANPGFAQKLLKINSHVFDVIGPAVEGQSRDRLTVPVSPVAEPSDAVLYEEPADASKRLYLPRYRLRAQGGRYEIGIVAAPDGTWRLTAGLERFPAPELGTEVRGAAEVSHAIAVFVRYGAGPTHAIEKVVDFEELVEEQKGVTVAVALDLAERDALLTALQTPAAAPALVVRRAFTVAIRIPDPRGTSDTPVRVRDHRRRTSPPGPAPSAARRVGASIDASLLATAVRPLAFEAQIVRPIRPAPPREARYRTVERALDDVAEPQPFVLDPRLHAYVYEGATLSGTSAAAFRRIVKPHPSGSPAARFHSYFQDVAEPWLFYYLPDQFKLSRREGLPFLPRMVVRIAAPDGDIERAAVTVDYVVEPSVDASRLRAAGESLRAEVPAGARHSEPELRPMQARSTLKLRLPGTAGVTLSDQEDVAIDLANGFVHSLTVPLDGFRELYAAAYSRDATSLFSGQVLVETGLSAPESIPLEIRFADTVGELLAFFEEPSDDDVVAVRMQNGIESPLRLSALPVRLRQGEQEVDADLEGLDLATPLDLPPEAEVSFRVRPRVPLTGEGVPTARFDTSKVDVLPDPERILPVISDTTVPAEYERQIDVMTMPELLGEASDPTSILLINVEFKGGSSLKLTRDQPEGVAQVRLPLMDLLLGSDVQGRYGFRQQIIHRNGAQVVDPDWREADFGVLVLPAR
jgi:hypothetical protein